MRTFPEQILEDAAKIYENEAGRDDVGASAPALEHSEPVQEVRHMSRCGHYRDSARENNTEQSENWQSIGELAARLVKGVRK